MSDRMSFRTHRVSVIIAVYNGAKYIEEALQSVFRQTYNDCEIIVADDGSTDNSLDILRQHDDAIHILTLPHRGVSATRNEAVQASRGEFIAFLDADDTWTPDKLEVQIGYLDQHPEFGLVYSYCTNFIDKGEGDVQLIKKVDFEGYIFKEIFTKVCFLNGTIMMRRSVFDDAGGYDESLLASEDFELSLRISRKYQIGRVAKPLLRRRIHQGSHYSSDYNNQYIYQLPIYEKYMSYPSVQHEVGMSKPDYMCAFILKFIFKNLYDQRPELIGHKLCDLEKYSPEMTAIA